MLLTAHGFLIRRVRFKPLRLWRIKRARPIARLFQRRKEWAVLRKLRRRS
jgi:hypothetical protein